MLITESLYLDTIILITFNDQWQTIANILHYNEDNIYSHYNN